MPRPLTATICIESSLTRRLDRASEDAALQGIAALTTELDQAGFAVQNGPDLNAYDSLDLWNLLTEISTEVVVFEAHGSDAQGLASINLEGIAKAAEADRGTTARLSADLIVFGSCGTGASPLIAALEDLVQGTTVVLTSDVDVRFSIGEAAYPEIVRAWSCARTAATPEAKARRINELLSASTTGAEQFTARVIEPA